MIKDLSSTDLVLVDLHKEEVENFAITTIRNMYGLRKRYKKEEIKLYLIKLKLYCPTIELGSYETFYDSCIEKLGEYLKQYK